MVDQQQAADGVEGRLMYLLENVATLHAASDMPWIAGRFEFLGEKALGASLSVLALPDETGRIARSRARRRARHRRVTCGRRSDIDGLPRNASAVAVFGEAEGHARAAHYRCACSFRTASARAGRDGDRRADRLQPRTDGRRRCSSSSRAT